MMLNWKTTLPCERSSPFCIKVCAHQEAWRPATPEDNPADWEGDLSFCPSLLSHQVINPDHPGCVYVLELARVFSDRQ